MTAALVSPLRVKVKAPGIELARDASVALTLIAEEVEFVVPGSEPVEFVLMFGFNTPAASQVARPLNRANPIPLTTLPSRLTWLAGTFNCTH